MYRFKNTFREQKRFKGRMGWKWKLGELLIAVAWGSVLMAVLALEGFKHDTISLMLQS